MRDERFKAVHRGGPLSLKKHGLLASWAADCVEHALTLFTDAYPEDIRPLQAVEAARAWSRGEITVGEARHAAQEAHAAAREVDVNTAKFVARAVGHAVATAHMADHAPGAALYVIKAIQALPNKEEAHLLSEKEQKWQTEQLPKEIKALVLSNLKQKKGVIV